MLLITLWFMQWKGITEMFELNSIMIHVMLVSPYTMLVKFKRNIKVMNICLPTHLEPDQWIIYLIR